MPLSSTKNAAYFFENGVDTCTLVRVAVLLPLAYITLMYMMFGTLASDIFRAGHFWQAIGAMAIILGIFGGMFLIVWLVDWSFKSRGSAYVLAESIRAWKARTCRIVPVQGPVPIDATVVKTADENSRYLSNEEQAVIAKYAMQHNITGYAVMRLALRVYQLYEERTAAGETHSFFGDVVQRFKAD
jgi:hypothetical protein